MTLAVRTLALALAVLLPAAAAAQQTGVISGRVTESATRTPISGLSVQALSLPGRQVVAAALTNSDGRYNLIRLPAGSYAVRFRSISYVQREVDAVQVDAGGTARVDVEMTLAATLLNPQVTTVSRATEKANEAPASVSVIHREQVAERVGVTAADLLRYTPGVDVTQGGLAQTNVVARGFNNAFSGSLLMLQDNRFAGVPSLRVNIPALIPTTSEDIERIEVVLGPGAALYGPNASAGVLHVITRSPFESQGTTITLDGGERSVMRVAGRHANALGERFAFKLSGEYLRGKDWEYRDPAEPAVFPATPSTPTARAGQPNNRDFDLERYGGEARADVRLADGSQLITSYGLAHITSGLELTGANGTSQIRNWTMQHLQTRFSKGRFFAQAFGNISDAGNADGNDLNGTFLLRTGQPIVDQSRLGALQFQHGFDWTSRATFLYGADYVFTNPRTANTINGRNEEDDNITEYGGYIHNVLRLAPQWDLVSAFRVDLNSRLDGRFYSPRTALVWKPSDVQNVRFSYNRAYSTPTNFNFFLDLLQGSLRPQPIGLPYDIRAVGVPETGFSFRRDCSGGINNLCMRSPFPYANGSVGENAFTAAVGYQNALAVALQRGLQASISAGIRQASPTTSQAQADQLAAVAVTRLRTLSPTSTQVGSSLRLLTPGSATPFQPYSADSVVDIAPLKASFVNNFEVGYKGIFGDKARIAIDGWYQRRENFITAALNFTPTVFVGGAQTAQFIQPELQQAFQQALQAGGMGQAQAQATANALAAGLSPSIAGGLAQVPAGTVVPDSRVTTNGDIAFTYRNIDQTIDLYGADVAFDMQLTQRLSMGATYSWVSETEFPEVQNGGEALALNAPDHKASLTTRWADDPRGYSIEMRGRYMNGFRVNSGVFIGDVPVNAFLDASIAWRPPVENRRWLVGINATNILDNRRPSFAGVPDIGRLVLTRVQYTF